MCVHKFIIIQSLEPHAEIVNEVSTAYDMALLNILPHTHTQGERGTKRKYETKTKVH